LVLEIEEGFDYDHAQSLASDNPISDFWLYTIGKPGTKETLPEKLRSKESPNDRRKVGDSICEGPFRF
jgi:hypothetical protein